MTNLMCCPHCLFYFEGEMSGTHCECPNCHAVFAPATSELELSDPPAPQWNEAGIEHVDSLPADDLGLGPLGAFDADDESLWVSASPTDKSDVQRDAARSLLVAAREQQASGKQSKDPESILDQLTGQSRSSSRHFKTIIVGVGILFAGLAGMARIASHAADGRVGAVFPALFLIIIAAGMCVIIYGFCRGVIDMFRGTRRGNCRT